MNLLLTYFAYGSNLHPIRLTERISSAKLVGAASLHGFQLAFHKQGQDDSGKCNLFRTDDPAHRVHGAVYTLESTHKPVLDQFEGKGMGYLDHQIEVLHNGLTQRCFTYLAQENYINDALIPYCWYKELVIRGACHLNFPPEYIASIEALVSAQDPDTSRHLANNQLLGRMIEHTEDASENYPSGTKTLY